MNSNSIKHFQFFPISRWTRKIKFTSKNIFFLSFHSLTVVFQQLELEWLTITQVIFQICQFWAVQKNISVSFMLTSIIAIIIIRTENAVNPLSVNFLKYIKVIQHNQISLQFPTFVASKLPHCTVNILALRNCPAKCQVTFHYISIATKSFI